MTNKELIELAREHATYDLPYSTLQLLNDLADTLEREEVLKKNVIISLRPFLPSDAELEALVSREIHLLQGPHNPPTQEDVITRQTRVAKLIKEAKDKLFGRKQKSNVPHWIIEDKGFGGMYIKCSVCGEMWCDLFDNTPYRDDHCPVCGIQMNEDAEEYF